MSMSKVWWKLASISKHIMPMKFESFQFVMFRLLKMI